jgi:hypothetical protein
MKNKINYEELNKIVSEIENYNSERRKLGIENSLKKISNGKFSFKKINPTLLLQEIKQNEKN